MTTLTVRRLKLLLSEDQLRRVFVVIFVIIAGVLGGGASVRAAPVNLPAAAYDGTADVYETSTNTFFDYAPGTYYGSQLGDSWELRMLPKRNYVATYNDAYTSQPGGYTEANFTFYFSVDGPSSVSQIPMQIAFTTWLGGNGAYDAYSSVQWPGAYEHFCSSSLGNCSSSIESIGNYFSEKHNFRISPNTSYFINLYASSDAPTYALSSNNVVPSNAYSIVDPMITIDPSFGNIGSYSLRFSPGVENGGQFPVPAPPTSFIIGAGLVIMEFVRRRSSKQKQFRCEIERLL